MKPETVSKDVEREALKCVLDAYGADDSQGRLLNGLCYALKQARAAQTKAGDVEAVARAIETADKYIYTIPGINEKFIARSEDYTAMAKAAIAAMPQASEWLPEDEAVEIMGRAMYEAHPAYNGTPIAWRSAMLTEQAIKEQIELARVAYRALRAASWLAGEGK